MGQFTRTFDKYAPDYGLPFGQTLSDLSTHLFVWGATGTGKTSGVLRPLIAQVASSKEYGLFIADGKGALPAECAKLPNYTLLDPDKNSYQIGLIENLTPAEVTKAIVDILPGNGDKENQFFKSQGMLMLQNGANIHQALCQLSPDEFQWGFAQLCRTIDRLQLFAADGDEPKEANNLLAYVTEFHIDSDNDEKELLQAIDFFNQLGQQAFETRTNIKATVDSWTKPIMLNEKLLKWAKTVKSDINIESVKNGLYIGVNLPAFKYGKAGTLVASLLKARVFKSIRLRAEYNWKEQGEKPVVFIVDEAQELIGQAELDIMPVARSLGLIGVYSTQNIDTLYAKFGKDSTEGLLNNFRSFVAFNSSPATLKWVSDQLGETKKIIPQKQLSGLFFQETLEDFMSNSSYDPTHPDAKLMMKYRHKISYEDTSVMATRRRMNFRVGGNNQKGSMIQATTSYKIEKHTLLDPAVAANQLSGVGIAIAQVQRGGVKRRDMIQTFGMDDNFDLFCKGKPDENWFKNSHKELNKNFIEEYKKNRKAD